MQSIRPGGVPFENQLIQPGGAWRMLARGEDRALVLHQYALAEPIQLEEPAPELPGPGLPNPAEPQPYGAPPGGCGGLIQPGVSTLGAGDVFSAFFAAASLSLACCSSMAPCSDCPSVCCACCTEVSLLATRSLVTADTPVQALSTATKQTPSGSARTRWRERTLPLGFERGSLGATTRGFIAVSVRK